MGTRGPQAASQITDDTLEKAASAYLDLEEAGKLSKQAVGRAVGLQRAPDWLDSPKFLEILEIKRFELGLLKLRGIAGVKSYVEQVVQLGVKEVYKRLKFHPEEIQSSTLFQSVSQFLKLLTDLSSSETGQVPTNVLITIKQELNLIPDPRQREMIARGLLSQFKSVAGSLAEYLPALPAAGQPIGTAPSDGEIIDVAPIGPAGSPVAPGLLPGSASGSRLWEDPTEDV